MKTVSHEYFVSLEVAKLLKKVGFNWKCKNLYDSQDNYNGITFTPSLKNWNVSNKLDYSAPTLEVAQRWLREVKNLVILIDIAPSYCNGKPTGYKFVIHVSCGNHICGEWKDTYEEAQEAGIKKAFEIILEKGK